MTEFRMRNTVRRRLVSRIMLPVIAVWFALMPYREGQGLPLALVPIGVALVETGGAVAVADATMTGIVTLVGAAAMALAIGKMGDSGNASGQVRVPLTTLPASSAAIPAPAASPSAPVIPAPYSSADLGATICIRQDSSGGGTYQELCSLCVVNYAPLTGGRSCQVNQSNAPIPNGTLFDTDPVTAAVSPVDSCGVGYTYAAGACGLSNARAAVPDNKQDIARSGTGLSTYTGDDSAAQIKTGLSTTSAANDTINASGTDENGAPRMVSIQAVSNGGSLVTIKTQKVDANGNSYLETRTLTVSPAGAITAGTNTTTAQNLVLSPTTNTFTVATAPASSFAPAAAPATSTGSTPVTVNFPSDYARQGEAASAANLVNLGLGPKLDALVATSPAPSDPTLPPTSQFDDAFFNGTFTNLLGWSVPSHSSQCPTASMSFYGSTLVMDAHCAIIDQFAGVLSGIAAAMWTIAALLIVLGA